MPLGRPFWTWWTAAVLTNLGDGIRLAAFPLLAAQLTDEPLLVAAVAAAGGLPWLLTGLSAPFVLSVAVGAVATALWWASTRSGPSFA